MPLLLALCACRTPGGPDEIAERYARALKENRLADAYALTSRAQREHLSEQAFAARYADEQVRAARAAELLAQLPSMRARSGTLEAVKDPEGWRVAELEPSEGPREVLVRFLAAVDARDFERAYSFLAQRWRARYTPARLKEDFAAEPAAAERLERIRAALAAPLAVTAEGAELPLGEGRAVRLTREADSYKVAALE